MKNIWEVTLDEITPEKLIEIENYLIDNRFSALTRNKLIEFGKYRNMLIAHMDNVEAHCKMRVIRAINVGLSPKEIAEALDIPIATIRKWIRQ